MNVFEMLWGLVLAFAPALVLVLVFRRETQRTMDQSINRISEEVAAFKEEFQPLVSRVFGMAGAKSGDVRAAKAIEQKIAGNLMSAQLPELEILTSLGILSEDIKEDILEHPEVIGVLLQRYGPLAKQLLASRGGGGQQNQSYDFGGG